VLVLCLGIHLFVNRPGDSEGTFSG